MIPAPAVDVRMRATALSDELEHFLGDPRDDSSRMPMSSVLHDDAAAAFPRRSVEELDSWGVHRFYVPAVHGGQLQDILTPMLLMRAVARRDVTAAVAHGKTVLGAVCAWAAADDSTRAMAAIVSAGDPVSWGLTEEGRGSDIASARTTASRSADGVMLDGHKWPIGNATRGRAITVLARTSDRPGARALSLVLLDKHKVDSARLQYRPRRMLHGIRGADISGIEFHATRLGPDCFVGEEGQGIELVLKSLQLTRTLCAALSLGAGDQAIEVIADGHLINSGRHGAAVSEGIADILLAEIVAVAGARAFHRTPDEMALVSAFVKYFVPDAVDGVFRTYAEILGGLSCRVETEAARFEKAARDARVVGIFDGNSVVNLNVIINEFPNISRAADIDVDEVVRDASQGADSEAFDMTRLRLVTRRGSRLLRALPSLVARLDDGRTHRGAVAAGYAIAAHYAELLSEAGSAERYPRPPVRQFALAEQLTLAFAAAAAIVHFLASRDAAAAAHSPLWHDDAWLRAALSRLTRRMGLPVNPATQGVELMDIVHEMRRGSERLTLIEPSRRPPQARGSA